MSSQLEKRIGENLAEVEGRIAEAAMRSGRRPGDVRLVAVTKYVGVELIEPLLACGCRTLGESRPQQLWPKAEALAGRDVAWHMIGPLQRNKVRRTLPLVEMVHSADSLRLVETIDRIAEELQLRRGCCWRSMRRATRPSTGWPPQLEETLPKRPSIAMSRFAG